MLLASSSLNNIVITAEGRHVLLIKTISFQETLILALSLLGELSSCHEKKCLVERQNSYCTGGQCGYSTCLNGERLAVCGEPMGLRQTCKGAGKEMEGDGHGVFSHQAKLEFIEAVMMVCFSCHTIAPTQKVSCGWKFIQTLTYRTLRFIG